MILTKRDKNDLFEIGVLFILMFVVVLLSVLFWRPLTTAISNEIVNSQMSNTDLSAYGTGFSSVDLINLMVGGFTIGISIRIGWIVFSLFRRKRIV